MAKSIMGSFESGKPSPSPHSGNFDGSGQSQMALPVRFQCSGVRFYSLVFFPET